MLKIKNIFSRFCLDSAFITKSSCQLLGCIYTICGFLSVWFSFSDCLPKDWTFWYKLLLSIGVLLGIFIICCIVVTWITLSQIMKIVLTSNSGHKGYVQYGGMPIIVVYPELTTKADIHTPSDFTIKVKNLWDKLSVFRDNKYNKYKVPVLHVPYNKALIRKVLDDSDLRIATKPTAGDYFYE